MFHKSWNNIKSSLLTRIVQSIDTALDSTAVDVMRVGLPDDLYNAPLILGMPGVLTWDRGHEITLYCKQILELHETCNINCEVPRASFGQFFSPGLFNRFECRRQLVHWDSYGRLD